MAAAQAAAEAAAAAEQQQQASVQETQEEVKYVLPLIWTVFVSVPFCQSKYMSLSPFWFCFCFVDSLKKHKTYKYHM